MTLRPPAGRSDAAERLIDALAPGGPALVIVRGHRGAGKTTLLRYLGDLARHRKHPLVELEGASGMTSVPYGAMAELLPADTIEGLAAHRAAVEALTGPETGPRTVAIIDDADRLDDASATAVAASIRDGRTLHVISLRSGTRVPASIDDLLTGEAVAAIELRPLDRSTVDFRGRGPPGGADQQGRGGRIRRLQRRRSLRARRGATDRRRRGSVRAKHDRVGIERLGSHRRPDSARSRESTLRSHAPAERRVIDWIAVGGAPTVRDRRRHRRQHHGRRARGDR